MNKLRHLVSRKKRRFVWQNFDLDLAYITKRIIAMGFPAVGAESMYRNSAKDLIKFLDSRHGSKYKVYNLCSEKSHQYDSSLFNGRVANYPFPDHSAPPFTIIEKFCTDAAAWLAEDSENVIAVHCKAGKGRTGVMICSYLLHSRDWRTSAESIAFYGAARTQNNKGLTIPSQKRYVSYYQDYLSMGRKLPAKFLFVDSVRVMGFPKNLKNLKVFIEFGSRGSVDLTGNPTFDLVNNAPNQVLREGVGAVDLKTKTWLPARWKSGDSTSMTLYKEVIHKKIKNSNGDSDVEKKSSLRTRCTFKVMPDRAMSGDVYIRFQRPGMGKSTPIGGIWLNTSFYKPGQTVTFTKAEIDKIAKDKSGLFSPKTSITIKFRGEE